MKIRNPKTRYHLNVKRSDKVLEVGGGHNPHKRSNTIVDKFTDSNYHRSGDIKVGKKQKFLQADGENLPFVDNAFDYVICNQVIEHVDDPVKFMQEQTRVSKRGYIEAPSLIGEYLHPKKSHKWLILEIDSKIVMVDKEIVGFKSSHDFGDLFLHYLPKHSLGYKMLQNTHGYIQNIKIEWKDDLEVIVNPTEDKYLKYFKPDCSIDDLKTLFPQKSLFKELLDSIGAFTSIFNSLIRSRLRLGF